MIAPENHFSIANTFTMNLCIVRLVKKGTLWRYIFCQDMHTPFKINPGYEIAVYNNDLERQIFLLREGFIGVRQEITASGAKIYFSQRQYES